MYRSISFPVFASPKKAKEQGERRRVWKSTHTCVSDFEIFAAAPARGLPTESSEFLFHYLLLLLPARPRPCLFSFPTHSIPSVPFFLSPSQFASCNKLVRVEQHAQPHLRCGHQENADDDDDDTLTLRVQAVIQAPCLSFFSFTAPLLLLLRAQPSPFQDLPAPSLQDPGSSPRPGSRGTVLGASLNVVFTNLQTGLSTYVLMINVRAMLDSAWIYTRIQDQRNSKFKQSYWWRE